MWLLPFRHLVVACALTTIAHAQQPAVGAPAPPIVADTWLNWEGDAPTVESQRGRVVLLEFWGTWCAPCVRAMPGIQKLHDRYGDRGLTVLAISYEPAEEMQPFLTEHAYSMPVGSDPERRTISAFGISGWPTTIVIDKEGRVAHVGTPYDAEAAVERALGLEAGAGALLTLYLDSLKSADKAAQRAALERLVEKATPEFDLQAWAKSHLAPDAVAEDGAPPPVAPPAKPTGKPADSADLLRRCIEAWTGNAAQRTQLLQQLGDSGASRFDLASFARSTYAEEFPFEADELEDLLREKKYAAVVEAIAQRPPTARVLAAAAKDRGLAAYCKSKAGEARTFAKKGLMAELWLFPLALPEDEALNREFFNELATNGMAQSQDQKTIVGVVIGGEMVFREHVEAFVESQLTQAIVMDDLAAGKPPRVRDIAKLFRQERKDIVRDLEGRYGKPEPRTPK